jgi:hypothetical protein
VPFSSRLVEKMVDDEIKQSFSKPSASEIFLPEGQGTRKLKQ